MKNHGATVKVVGVGVVVVGLCWLVVGEMTTVDVVVGPEVGEVTGIDTASDEGGDGVTVVVGFVASGSDETVAQEATNIASAIRMANLRLISC